MRWANKRWAYRLESEQLIRLTHGGKTLVWHSMCPTAQLLTADKWMDVVRDKYVVTEEGCWRWTAFINPRTGYGQTQIQTQFARIRGKQRKLSAHRASWIAYRGPILPGMQLDHLCRNRYCINPDHLEPVTQAENLRRGRRDNPFRPRAKKRTPQSRAKKRTPQFAKLPEQPSKKRGRGRPALEVGQHGRINRTELEKGVWVAKCRYRDTDGVTRIVERKSPAYEEDGTRAQPDVDGMRAREVLVADLEARRLLGEAA